MSRAQRSAVLVTCFIAAIASNAEAQVAPGPGVEVAGVTWRAAARVRPRLELRVDPYRTSDTSGDVAARRGPDQGFVTSRARLSLDGRANDLRLFVEVQDARSWGDTAPGSDGGAATGLHQGYLDIGNETRWLRVGRQELAIGAERLLGSLQWSSAARSFDAIRAHTASGAIELDAFGAWVRPARTITTAMPALSVDTAGDFLLGVAAKWQASPELRLEPYVLYRHDGPTEAPAGAVDPSPQLGRHRDIVAIAARASGQSGAVRFDLEGVAQLGSTRIDTFDGTALEDGDAQGHLAFAAFADVGLTVAQSIGGVASLGAAFATGRSEDGDIDEFDNFFPTNHAPYGTADLVGWRNLIDPFVRFQIAPPGAKWSGSLEAHALMLADPSARWSDASGRTVGRRADNDDRFLGAELDLEAKASLGAHVTVTGGYALFLPMSGAESLAGDGADGATTPTHWIYAAIDGSL